MMEFVELLLKDYERGRDIDLSAPVCRPDNASVEEWIDTLRILVFPGYFRRDTGCTALDSYISMGLARACFLLESQIGLYEADEKTRDICREFLRQIPGIRHLMQLDLQAFQAGDPAAESLEEIIVSYPGFYAILVYRLANALYRLGVKTLPRMMTELAHSKTGIDIHPGASIGPSFFIDHGTGVVIGQTTEIAENVKLYQGVTLGALSTRGGRSLTGVKRHPTIERNVTIYAGASILGGETVIGEGATIGGNAFITASVPAFARIRGLGL